MASPGAKGPRLALTLVGPRQDEREGRALARVAGDLQVARHGAGEVATDGQAESDPFVGAGEAAAELDEGLEDVLLLFLGDAGPGR